MNNAPIETKIAPKTSTKIPVITMALAVLAFGGLFAFAVLAPKAKKIVTPVESGTGTTTAYSNIKIISTTTTSVTIGWDTTRTTCSRINYGTVVNQLNSGPVSETAPCTGTTHQATITNLTAGTVYLYEIVGGGSLVSGQQTFTTSGVVAGSGFTWPKAGDIVQGWVTIVAVAETSYIPPSSRMDLYVDAVKQETDSEVICDSVLKDVGCTSVTCRYITTCSGHWNSVQGIPYGGVTNGEHSISGKYGDLFSVGPQNITVANPSISFTKPGLETPYPMVQGLMTVTTGGLMFTTNGVTMDILVDGVDSGTAVCTGVLSNPGCVGNNCRYDDSTCTGSVDTTKLTNGVHDLSVESVHYYIGPQKINVNNFLITTPIEGATIKGIVPISAVGLTANLSYSIPTSATLLIDNQTNSLATLSCTSQPAVGCIVQCPRVLTCTGSLNTTRLKNGTHTLRVKAGITETLKRTVKIINASPNVNGPILIPDEPVTTPN